MYKKALFQFKSNHFVTLGKILDNDKAISEYNIDAEKNFVVVMAVKVGRD